MPTLESLHARREAILAVASRHGASNLRIFGSVARGDTHAGSDLDVLIDLAPGRSLLDLIAVKQDLEELLDCKLDIGTARSLRPRLKERVLQEAVTFCSKSGA